MRSAGVGFTIASKLELYNSVSLLGQCLFYDSSVMFGAMLLPRYNYLATF